MAVLGAIFVVTGLVGLFSDPGVHAQGGTSENSISGLLLALFLGGTVLTLAILLGMIRMNSRIEIVDGVITSFNLRGKPEVAGALKGAEILPEAKSSCEKRTLRTDGGDITIRLSIEGYGILWSAITGLDRVSVPSSYVPEERTFKAWKQQITIGPNGITESDRSGRVRLHAELDQIVAMGTVRGEDYDLYLIHTTVGTIRTVPSLRKSAELGVELRRVIETRPTHQ